MTTARQIAVEVLNRSRAREAFAAELIDDALGSGNISPQGRRFVTQLVFGVIRRRGTLDALLKPFIQIPLHAVQPRVWDILRLGAFQLTFLTHVPKHAAVHETVELAPYVGALKAKGFVNGVLRRVSELVTDEFVEKAGSDAVPVGSAQPHLTPRPPSLGGKGEKEERVLTPPSLPGKEARGLGSGEGGEQPVTPASHIVRGQRVTKGKHELAKALRREMTPEERIVW